MARLDHGHDLRLGLLVGGGLGAIVGKGDLNAVLDDAALDAVGGGIGEEASANELGFGVREDVGAEDPGDST